MIYLFMCGGVSHLDTFDPKDNRLAGTLVDAVGFGDNLAEMKRPVIPCRRTFTRHGRSGTPVSDWFPHVAGVIDEIALVRSMWCHETNHFPAVIETATGHRNRIVEHPAFGSWISYALGTENSNLPTFVHMGKASSPLQLSGGYLGASFAATPFQPGDIPIRNLRPPAGPQARVTASLLVVQQADHGRGDLLDGGAVDEDGRVADHLGHGPHGARHHGGAAAHGLEDGKPRQGPLPLGNGHGTLAQCL